MKIKKAINKNKSCNKYELKVKNNYMQGLEQQSQQKMYFSFIQVFLIPENWSQISTKSRDIEDQRILESD